VIGHLQTFGHSDITRLRDTRPSTRPSAGASRVDRDRIGLLPRRANASMVRGEREANARDESIRTRHRARASSIGDARGMRATANAIRAIRDPNARRADATMGGRCRLGRGSRGTGIEGDRWIDMFATNDD